MEGNFWKTWVVVGTLSFFGTSSLPHTKPLTYKEVVALAVTIYNSRSGEDCVYRLLGALAEPQWDQPKRVKRFLRVFQKLKKDIQKLFKKEKMVTGPLSS